jgi:hypothetical protein
MSDSAAVDHGSFRSISTGPRRILELSRRRIAKPDQPDCLRLAMEQFPIQESTVRPGSHSPDIAARLRVNREFRDSESFFPWTALTIT